MTRLLVFAALTGLLGGCTYTVAVHANATGARIEQDDGATLLPAELTVPWTPWRRRRAVVSAPGYRPLTLDLGWRTITTSDAGVHRWVFKGAEARTARIEVELVRDHGASGTWTPEQLGIETQ